MVLKILQSFRLLFKNVLFYRFKKQIVLPCHYSGKTMFTMLKNTIIQRLCSIQFLRLKLFIFPAFVLLFVTFCSIACGGGHGGHVGSGDHHSSSGAGLVIVMVSTVLVLMLLAAGILE